MPLSFTSTGVVAPGGAPSSAWVDGSLWPLLLVKFGRSATLRDLEAYLAVRAEWLQRCEPHLCIIDTRELHLPHTSLRQRYTEWLSEHEAGMRQWMLGTAYIIQSPEVRMMMSVIRHCAPLSTPYVVTATLPSAATWAAERLQEAGLPQAATRVRAHFAIPAS